MFGFLCDMDGVLSRGRQVVPGAVSFVKNLQKMRRPYLLLTNNPDSTPRELSRHLKSLGMDVPPSHFCTSAQATAAFLQSQSPRPRVCAIGAPALLEELEAIGAHLSYQGKPAVQVVLRPLLADHHCFQQGRDDGVAA